jgi:hypothetical protein
MALWNLFDTNCCTKSKYMNVQSFIEEEICFYFREGRLGDLLSTPCHASNPTKEIWSSCLLDCN